MYGAVPVVGVAVTEPFPEEQSSSTALVATDALVIDIHEVSEILIAPLPQVDPCKE